MAVTLEGESPWNRDQNQRRRKKFSAKREAIVRTAANLFRERDYDGTSLGDLADILAITKPTLYYYFESKEHLLVEIMTLAQERVLTTCRSTLASDENGFEKLRMIMLDYAQLMATDFGACLGISRRHVVDSKARADIDRRIDEANRIIYKVLDEGLKDGTLKFVDRTVTLHALFGSLNSMSAWVKEGGRLSSKKLATLQVDLLLNGVRGEAVHQSRNRAEPQTPKRTKRS